MGKTMSAQRMKKYRERLKNSPKKKQIHLSKERERDKKRRENIKKKENSSARLKNKRRAKETERKRKYREKIKLLKQTATTTGEQSSSSLGSYSCKQTLGKAVSRVNRTLPSSPTKKIAVMRKLVLDLGILGDDSFLNRPSRKSNVIHALPDDHKGLVTEFYQRDDISRQAPGIKDVKSVKDLKSGDRVLCQKRHMNMTVREAYSLFILEYPDIKIKIAKFYQLRPAHVFLTSEMPHNVCVCKYHANFNFLVESIAKRITGFPSISGDLLEKICCNSKREECMLGHCIHCKSYDLLSLLNNNEDLFQPIEWKKWIEIEGRSTVVTVRGSIEVAIIELNNQLDHFKRHVYIKRVQSQAFNDAKCNMQPNEVVLQIDFAENYAAVTQDEIQSAHWSHKQITVFTACAWLPNDRKYSFALISDVLRHDKHAVFACLKKIMTYLKDKIEDLDIIKIFSDGAASQFKNRFTLLNLCYMPHDFGITGSWYFFATSHGKGAVDGVGAIVKRAVWSQVKQRKVEINSAEDFVVAAGKTVKNINILHLSKEEIEANRKTLDSRWKLATGIDKIQSLHFFKGYNQDDLLVGTTADSDLTRCKAVKLSVSNISSDTDSSSWSDSDYETLASILRKKNL